MIHTTLLAIREVVAEAVLGIDPSFPEYTETEWNRVKAIRDTTGALRNFFVRLLPSRETTESFYGDGISKESELQIWVGYDGLPDDEDGPMVDEDGRQLYLALVATIDPTNNGIEAYTPTGWVYEVEDPGHVVGYHSFVVRFLSSDELNP